jgi:hypothetical protein
MKLAAIMMILYPFYAFNLFATVGGSLVCSLAWVSVVMEGDPSPFSALAGFPCRLGIAAGILVLVTRNVKNTSTDLG